MDVIASRQQLRTLRERLRGGDFRGRAPETSRSGDDAFSMNARLRMRARAFCS